MVDFDKLIERQQKPYHKILTIQPRHTDIKMTTRDLFGKKFSFLIKNFLPYAFIAKKHSDKLSISTQYIDNFKDEGFTDIWGNPMFTVYFKHPSHVPKQRDKIGAEFLLQSDIHYELAFVVKKGLNKFIKINDLTGLIAWNEIDHNDIIPISQAEVMKLDFDDYLKGFIDIEVKSEHRSIFPNEHEAKYPIVSAVTSFKGKSIAFIVGSVDFLTVKNKLYDLVAEVKEYPTEKFMLNGLYKEVNEWDVALAWNSKFEQNYLNNRSNNLNLDLDWNTIGWFNLQQGVASAQEFTTSFLALKKIFDDLFMYKRHAWKFLPPIFQDYFSEEEGKSEADKGKGMVTINEDSQIYQYLKFRKSQSGGDVIDMHNEKRFQELLFYNACDVWDMIMLETVGGVDGFFNMIDGLGLLKMNDIFFHNSKIEPSALRFCMLNKVASPSKLYLEGKIEEGALVHDAKKGKILKNVIVTDFSRFYISIILARLVSPENINGNKKKLFTIMPNGEKLSQPMFFLPALAHYLINARNHAEDMKLKTKDKKMKDYWSKQAKALKTTTSGLWGYIAQSGIKETYVDKKGKTIKKKKAGRYFAKHVGDEILLESRNKMTSLTKFILTIKINGDTFTVVYGDTDSIFIMRTNRSDKPVDPISIAKRINVYFEQMCLDQGYPMPIVVNAEKMYDRLLLVSKKYYYGRIVWADGEFLKNPKFDIKGMQAKRSDHSQLGKDFQYSLIQNHLEYGMRGITRTISRMNKFITQGFMKNQSRFIESIAIPWKIRKPMKEYKSGQWNYFRQSALVWNNYAKLRNLPIDNQLGFGKSAFIILIKSSRIKGLDLINKYLVFPQGDLIDWTKIEIDEFAMKNKTVKEKITNILTSMGIEKDEIDTISKGKRMQKPNF